MASAVFRWRASGWRDSSRPPGSAAIWEILSLAGTLSRDGAHLHIAVADSRGQVVGGHLAHGSLVRTTAELVVGLLPEWTFRRELDPATGWRELVIELRGRE